MKRLRETFSRAARAAHLDYFPSAYFNKALSGRAAAEASKEYRVSLSHFLQRWSPGGLEVLLIEVRNRRRRAPRRKRRPAHRERADAAPPPPGLSSISLYAIPDFHRFSS